MVVRVVVSLLGCRATLAVHPARIAAAIMLFLPDGQAVFDLIDDEPARIERFAAVRRADAHPHGEVGEFEAPHAMNAQRMLDGKSLRCVRPP
jgi:hypothetical protein